MNDQKLKSLEEKLSKLPTFKRSKMADFRFRFMLFKKQLQSIGFQLAQRSLAASLAAIILFLGGGGVYAQSNHVTHGNFFYSFKKATEAIEIALATTPQAKVDKHLKFAENRQAELDVLLNGKSLAYFIETAYAQDDLSDFDEATQEAIEATADDMIESTEAAMETSTEIEEGEVADETLSKIEAIHERQAKWLAQKEARSERLRKSLESVRVVTEENWSEVVHVRAQVQEALKEAQAERRQVRVEIAFKKKEASQKRATQRARNNRLSTLQKEAQEELQFAERRLKSLREQLSESEVEPEVIEAITQRAKERLKQARQAIDSGQLGKSEGLSRATQELIQKAPSRLEMRRRATIQKTQEEAQNRVKIEPRKERPSPLERQQKIDEDREALRKALENRKRQRLLDQQEGLEVPVRDEVESLLPQNDRKERRDALRKELREELVNEGDDREELRRRTLEQKVYREEVREERGRQGNRVQPTERRGR